MLARNTQDGMIDCRTHDIWSIRRILSADRQNDIHAILVAPSVVEDAKAIVDYCWHDAEVIAANHDTLRHAA